MGRKNGRLSAVEMMRRRRAPESGARDEFVRCSRNRRHAGTEADDRSHAAIASAYWRWEFGAIARTSGADPDPGEQTRAINRCWRRVRCCPGRERGRERGFVHAASGT